MVSLNFLKVENTLKNSKWNVYGTYALLIFEEGNRMRRFIWIYL